MRRAAFHVNGSRSAERRALANVRKHQKTLGYKRQRRNFSQSISTYRMKISHPLGVEGGVAANGSGIWPPY